MIYPYLISNGYALTRFDGDLARGHLHHPDADEAHEPNGGVVCLDEDQRVGGRDSGPWLGADQGAVRVIVLKVWVVDRRTIVRECCIVRAGQCRRLGGDAVDGSVPAVVVCGAEGPLG